MKGPIVIPGHVYGGDSSHAVWLVLRDPCAGKKKVYTVYRIWLRNKEAHVIGRELVLPDARALVNNDMAYVERNT